MSSVAPGGSASTTRAELGADEGVGGARGVAGERAAAVGGEQPGQRRPDAAARVAPGQIEVALAREADAPDAEARRRLEDGGTDDRQAVGMLVGVDVGGPQPGVDDPRELRRRLGDQLGVGQAPAHRARRQRRRAADERAVRVDEAADRRRGRQRPALDEIEVDADAEGRVAAGQRHRLGEGRAVGEQRRRGHDAGDVGVDDAGVDAGREPEVVGVDDEGAHVRRVAPSRRRRPATAARPGAGPARARPTRA